MNEHELINEIKQIAIIDFKMKIIDISDDLLLRINSEQYNMLLQLKKYKWSLQYYFE